MANDTVPPAAPATDPTADAVADLTKRLKTESEKHAFQKKRADGLEKTLKEREVELEAATKKQAALETAGGRMVFLDGEAHEVIGVFRADNTFTDVKRGYCPEGATLVAIAKPH